MRKLAYGFSSILLSISSLFVLMSPVAYAANISWDGEGDGINFNDEDNWSGDTLPTASDVIVFDADVMTGTVVLQNDIPGFSVTGISLIDSSPGSGSTPNLIINGNDITVNGDISNTNNSFYFPQLNINLILGTDSIINGSFQISDSQVIGKSINLNGHNLTFSPYGSSDVRLNSQIIGTGNIVVSQNTTIELNSQNLFHGTVTVQGTVQVKDPQGLGSNLNDVVVEGTSGNINFCFGAKVTVPNNITLNSANTIQGSLASTTTCGWFTPSGPSSSADLFLSGNIVLSQDSKVWSDGEMKLSIGALSGSGFKLNILDGVPGTLNIESSSNNTATSNGIYKSALKSVVVSDTAKTTQVISYNEQVTVNSGAEAGDIYLYGGALKGIGKVGNINMSGGAVASGMSPGILASNNFTTSGGTFEAEIGGTGAGEYDQLNVTGTVNLGSATTLNVTHWNNYRPSQGNTFTIINNYGADAVSGTFSGLAQGATITVDNIVYTISYNGGDGNDVVLTATSVPTTPNTGFNQYKNNVYLSSILTLVIVAGLVAISRRIKAQ